MRVFFLFFFSSFFSSPLLAQQEKITLLPKISTEISGLELLNDSTLLAINDGGNASEVFLYSLNGLLIRKIYLKNAKNIDWEDVAYNAQTQEIVIGDIGDNAKQRKSIQFIRIDTDAIAQDTISPKIQHYTYPNHIFDSEAICFVDSSLLLFTKATRNKPYSGISYVFSVPKNGEQLQLVDSLNLGNDGYFKNSITAADYINGQLFLLTYSSLYIYQKTLSSWKFQKRIKFKRLTQKESLVCRDKNTLFLADERSFLWIGRNLYKLKIND